MLQDGYTPQAVAARRNNSQVVALLAENEKKSKTQLPALHAAAKKDDVNAAWALLRREGRSNKVRAICNSFILCTLFVLGRFVQIAATPSVI